MFCFCSSWKVKNVHSLFTELSRHKPTLHDFNIVVVFPSKKSPDVRHGDRSQLSRSLIGQIQVSLPSFHIPISCLWSQLWFTVLAQNARTGVSIAAYRRFNI